MSCHLQYWHCLLQCVRLCVVQEATQLSSLLPELISKGVPLYGVVLEEKGAHAFNEYLKGEMLFDEEVHISF